MATAIEVFCGCGGISTGLLDAGVEVLSGFDHDRRCIETFDYNHAYRGARGKICDLSHTTGAELLAHAGVNRVDLLAGGPPCQPFSIVGKRLGLEDHRGGLIFDFVRLVSEIQPNAVLFENVAAFASHGGGSLASELSNSIASLGYKVSSAILCAADYGVPQARRRFFLVGTRFQGKLRFPLAPTHAGRDIAAPLLGMLPYVTCKEAIGDLPDVTEEASQGVHNHEPTMHTAAMVDALARLPPGRRDRKSFHDRLHPDRLSYTLRAGSGNFSPLRPVHYQHPRVITVRESARLQGFPDNFVWPDWVPRLQQYRQVGNAVPPVLARRLAESVAEQAGWNLDPEGSRGDPTDREPPTRSTYEERRERRGRLIRGASLGLV